MNVGPLHLVKHHGLGNDFLILLDPPDQLDAPELARQACARRRGIGADGLLIARPGVEGADVTMELRNADGGRAEMSGNGIRCFAHALWDAGRVQDDRIVIATDGGLRAVRRVGAFDEGGRSIRAAVDMGPVKVVADAPEWIRGSVEQAALVDAGNPHLVLLDPSVREVDIQRAGPMIESQFPDGINVEWIWPGPDPGALTLRVWERGAGETEACGTGSCAAVAAGVSWGRIGPEVMVHNPGGDVTVELADTATLIGPSTRIAAVEVMWP